MINIEVQQHDKFSIEIKSGVTITRQSPEDVNEFFINTWIFFPNSLDINRLTYSKEQFYKDVKTNIRLITPIYSLEEILTEGRGPFIRLEKSIKLSFENPTDERLIENYSYQIKMLMCILNSALRKEASSILCSTEPEESTQQIEEFVNKIRLIIQKYRNHQSQINSDVLTDAHRQLFSFGDEYLVNITEKHVFLLLRKRKSVISKSPAKALLTSLAKEEAAYKKAKGYMVLDEKEEHRNSLVILQRNILKKFMESDLFLQVEKKTDGAFAKQVYYGVAAGMAMIFATVITFVATQQFGNFTTDLFIILVISYIFKDRIKEVMRYYFTSTMSKKYFDSKLNLSIRQQEIGHMKESFDFIKDDRLPEEIIALRNRTPLVEAENKVYDEKIVLYRKRISLSKKKIERYKEYHLTGINDITRFNLTHYLQKMDNPSIPLYMLNEADELETINGEKVYSLYFILNCISNTTEYYKKYRLLFNRTGITAISELS